MPVINGIRLWKAGNIAFDTNPNVPTHLEGLVYWDDNANTLAIMTDVDGVVLQVGQETFVKVRNDTGALIENGSVVYITGATGNRVTIAKAQANDAAKTIILGVVTEDIAHNADGYVTTAGLVRDLDTNSFTEGDTLYLSETTAGGLRNTQPAAPNFSVRVGYVTRKSPAVGVVLVAMDGNQAFGCVCDGNYTQFEPDGTMVAYGDATCWRDELQSLIGQRLESPGSDITRDLAEGTVVFDDATTLADYVTMNVQLNHDRKIGENVEVHVHWFQASANVPNWLVQYRWQSNGDAKVTAWTDSADQNEVFTYTSGTILQITDLAEITPPAGDGVSDILQLRLIRDTDNDSGLFAGTDPLTGDVAAVNMDVHMIINTLGSRLEYQK